MAIVEFSQLDVSFRGTEANNIFLEPVFFDDDLRSQFRVLGNVANKKKMVFVAALENIVRKYSGCGFTPVGKTDIYERTIDVEKMKVDLEMCWDEFEDTVFEELLKTGTRLPDVSGTLIENILLTRTQQAIRQDINRLSYFGDQASNNPNYDSLDGFWTVFYPDLVANDLIPRTDTGSGSALAAGDGFGILRAVYDQAPLQLKGLPANQKVFNVTGSVYSQLREDIEEGGGGDYGLLQLINGQEQFTFRGVPVVAQWRWDEIATSLGTTLPNYVEYTTPLNKVLATDVLSPETALELWYDQKEEKVYVKARFKMGVNYIHNSLISVGY
ncbi:MAG: hypothetical protein EBQ89_03380 [Alphaproteobacteria bacterium]|nr:hypothetical protein [Alphaproteobacteria bacterium]